MSLQTTDTKLALSKLKDLKEDISHALEQEESEITINLKDLNNIECIIQTIKMLEKDYERLFDKLVIATIQRAQIVGKDNLKDDLVAQTLIAITKSEEATQ